MLYKRPNRRKCYWLCRDCLKGHNQCSTRCPDYVSVARAERAIKEKTEWRNAGSMTKATS